MFKYGGVGGNGLDNGSCPISIAQACLTGRPADAFSSEGGPDCLDENPFSGSTSEILRWGIIEKKKINMNEPEIKN